MIVWLIFILIVSVLIWDYLKCDQRKVKLAKQFKGPVSVPVLGNLYMYLNKKPEGEILGDRRAWTISW